MSATVHHPPPAKEPKSWDFDLGLPGFKYSDLNRVRRLEALDQIFRDRLAAEDAPLAEELERHRAGQGPADRKAASDLLVRVAPHLGRFVAKLFMIEREVEALGQWTREEGKLFEWKRKFLLPRVLRKEPDHAARAAMDLAALEREYEAVAGAPRFADLRCPQDLERELGQIGLALLDDPSPEGKAALATLERFLVALAHHPALRERTKGWATLRMPEPLEFDALVPIIRPYGEFKEKFEGLEGTRRARDGFQLTDERMSGRQALGEVHYCIYCHEREKDSCSTGLMEKDGTFKRNPLGIPLEGCPLEEKISEAHLLKRRGEAIGALAVVVIDNPMCPGTGHRICNDCMKSCIFQKQEPVNIPQAETRILTDVLNLPYGVEIYGLLTRWNPLNRERPFPLRYNGKNVLVVGMGPAGYTLAHHLLQEGYGVVGIDGLKIEPLATEVVGARRRVPRPIKEWATLRSSLEDRILLGFGGVSEYGITVRWDKNFLDLIYLTLLRRKKFRLFGGVRFGGTVTIEDAWAMGFDHIAIAAGAGRPTIVPMKNNLIRGVRKASDFLMALQLSGAQKRNGLANLQVRLPAVVIGGGLTAIDTATELAAYYIVQVEKTLDRFTRLAEKIGEQKIWARMAEEEAEVTRELLEHGRAVAAERRAAAAEGRAPDLAGLVRGWGGVTIAYRKRLQDSPAYRLNHEEVVKALEEGISIAECWAPLEVVPDRFGAARALLCERQAETAPGKWRATGEKREIPARAIMVAAGTHPNSIYEKEFPGTFKRDKWGEFYLGYKAERDGDGRVRLVPAAEGEAGFFTSYEKDGKLVSYYGDNHPEFEGNVVKAMASAKHGFRALAALFRGEIARQSLDDQPLREERWVRFGEMLEDGLRARVVDVVRLTPTIVEVIVRAPLAARNFKPGQFYRLQNYESFAQEIEGFRLTMEGIALTGAWVDRSRGLLSLIVLEMGHSSRLCGLLQPGEKVVVMGPTGAPTEIPSGETVLLAGGGLGNAVLFSIAEALKAAGNRVIYFAGYKNAGDLFKRDEIEKATDIIVWSVDRGEPIKPRRPQDRTFVGNIVQAMDAYARGDLGPKPIELPEVSRIIAIGSDRMMNAVRVARKDVLACHLRPDHVAIASINTPMQCMMKEVCAQCLQKHVDPATGKESEVVFSCFNQDQKLDEVDFQHLADRLKQNGAAEKLADLWLDYLIEMRELTKA